jgi:NADH-ubiquinone oxidoreductase chain 5
MYLSVLILPFISFFSCIFFGRFIGVFGACFLSTGSIALCFVLSVFTMYETLILGSSCNIDVGCWIQSELLVINWGFYFDGISTIMLCVVTGISALVHLYSIEYMFGDPHQIRFMSYLSLFTGFMLFLVTSDNLLVMFFGWEGIGLASFLLISFWHTRIQASKSAIKAMLVNRVGDIGLALSICVTFLTYKSVDYALIFALTPVILNKSFIFFGFDINILTVITILIFWGVLGKSAQIPLHIWLPDAMEGPTPVSALIHAATLVVAGVFLIIRCSALFDNCESVLMIVSVIGAMTSFFAATVGLFQNDLKRVIAYSTCSQLGYMIFISGLSYYSVSLFHLANHAVFKALLFLSAGCIIHGLSDEQDLRKFGGILYLFPVSFVMILIGSLALVGTPFLTGFYSKDCILELAFAKHNFVGNFCYFLGCSAAFCTAFYSFRLVFLTFVNPTNTYKSYIQGAHEAPLKMIIPLMILGFGAIFHGFLTKDGIIGLGSLFFNNIFTRYTNFNMIDSEFLPSLIKNVPFIFTIFGATLSLYLINCFNVNKSVVFQKKLSFIPRYIYIFLNKKWHWDQLTNELIVIKSMNFGYNISFLAIDKGFIEHFGPTGLTKGLYRLSFNFSSIQEGFLFNTIFLITLFIIIILSYYFSHIFVILSICKTSFLLLFFSYALLSLCVKD